MLRVILHHLAVMLTLRRYERVRVGDGNLVCPMVVRADRVGHEKFALNGADVASLDEFEPVAAANVVFRVQIVFRKQ
jgi:hypothetical protein